MVGSTVKLAYGEQENTGKCCRLTTPRDPPATHLPGTRPLAVGLVGESILQNIAL